MEPVNDKLNADVGVIVGRFQVPVLHEAHKDLINSVRKNHPRTILVLGLSPLYATVNNPLDYKAREQMIRKEFPDVELMWIKDVNNDTKWSKQLDFNISSIVGPNDTVTLYGSRDSFLAHYNGRYQTQELVSNRIISGTEIRQQVKNNHTNSPEFRAGVIWATMNRFPSVVTTVDIAIVDDGGDGVPKVLLAKKPDEDKYRFVGGFSSPKSKSFEEDAKREAREETGLEVTDLQYIGSYRIDDWRYRDEIDKINTVFYVGFYTHGRAEANDDISEVAWVPTNKLNKHMFMPEHVVLYEALDISKIMTERKRRVKPVL